eukprot:TRINITY_DN49648_c0_g1_i1.p1 TRINITY_DN49648_c0_g1~~TRINITY_DN49648_c0_g1_i1.p1  ORF type:complete len:390 (-),score=58.73 TRINITY_DN49648_c0_g1_i1:413-1582(-)
MAEPHFLITSESVTEGHPDKLCDRIAEAVVDACLTQDADARVSCEACTKTGMVMVLGQVVTKATVNYEQVIREVVKFVGYDNDAMGMNWRTMNIIVALDEKVLDFSQAMCSGRTAENAGLGQHGVAAGYATNESPEMVPVSHVLASKLSARLDEVRRDGILPWVRPDARVQVIMEYKSLSDGSVAPSRVHKVDIAAQCANNTKPQEVERDLLEHVVKYVLPEQLLSGSTQYNLRAISEGGGSMSRDDVGFSGRQQGSDTYGFWGPQVSSSFVGKDALKIARGASYGARWVAKSLVAAGLCHRCSVQLTYSADLAEPSAVCVDSHGSATRGKSDAALADIVKANFDLRTACLQRELGLKEPRFQALAAYGHFGRTNLNLPWEAPKSLILT